MDHWYLNIINNPTEVNRNICMFLLFLTIGLPYLAKFHGRMWKTSTAGKKVCLILLELQQDPLSSHLDPLVDCLKTLHCFLFQCVSAIKERVQSWPLNRTNLRPDTGSMRSRLLSLMEHVTYWESRNAGQMPQQIWYAIASKLREMVNKSDFIVK